MNNKPNLTTNKKDFEDKISLRIKAGEELIESIDAGKYSDLHEVSSSHNGWSSYNKDLLNTLLSDDTFSKEFARCTLSMSIPINASNHERALMIKRDIEKQVATLKSFIERAELFEVQPATAKTTGVANSNSKIGNVFIVHGHDLLTRYKLKEVIEKLSLNPIILDDLPNSGQTIIEKLESTSLTVQIAVVILTGDDKGCSKNEDTLKPRARQNVLIELGYFLAHLGRKNVIALHEKDVEIPSDYSGVCYISLENDWVIKLAKELKSCGADIDMNKLF